ncbi:MAG: hypothetical protein K2W82_08355 [Candidatus Obscuribacterales bacterium]|nr:hypothetical protein [Candidatus Obscuribacterales bacterium]
MSDSGHHDAANTWLTFFIVCFFLVMAIGIWAIFTYNANAPEPTPGGGGGHGYIIPDSKENLLLGRYPAA